MKGSRSSGSCTWPGDDVFVIQNSSSDTVAYINSTGDLCATDCNDNDADCDNPGDGSFIVKDIDDSVSGSFTCETVTYLTLSLHSQLIVLGLRCYWGRKQYSNII